MALYIDVRINTKVIATARVRNVSPDGETLCDYEGDARTCDFGDMERTVAVNIRQHDRRQTVWALVSKIAEALR